MPTRAIEGDQTDRGGELKAFRRAPRTDLWPMLEAALGVMWIGVEPEHMLEFDEELQFGVLAGARTRAAWALREWFRSGGRAAVTAELKQRRRELEAVAHREVMRGMRADKRSKWVVLEVLDARRKATGGVELLMLWAGHHQEGKLSWTSLVGSSRACRREGHAIMESRAVAKRVVHDIVDQEARADWERRRVGTRTRAPRRPRATDEFVQERVRRLCGRRADEPQQAGDEHSGAAECGEGQEVREVLGVDAVKGWGATGEALVRVPNEAMDGEASEWRRVASLNSEWRERARELMSSNPVCLAARDVAWAARAAQVRARVQAAKASRERIAAEQSARAAEEGARREERVQRVQAREVARAQSLAGEKRREWREQEESEVQQVSPERPLRRKQREREAAVRKRDSGAVDGAQARWRATRPSLQRRLSRPTPRTCRMRVRWHGWRSALKLKPRWVFNP